VTQSAKQTLGKWGEERAVEQLTGRGYAVLARNWRKRNGEIDIVARAPDGTLCFVEVRTTRGTRFGGAAASLTAAKRRTMTALAQAYLAETNVEAPARFDVIAHERRDGTWRTEHFEGAFLMEES
jgi:putative endonuclease